MATNWVNVLGFGPGASWIEITGAGSAYLGSPSFNEVPGGFINGSNVTFTVAYAPINNSLALYRNGARQTPGVGNDYTISGLTITMSTAPYPGDNLLCDYWH